MFLYVAIKEVQRPNTTLVHMQQQTFETDLSLAESQCVASSEKMALIEKVYKDLPSSDHGSAGSDVEDCTSDDEP